MRGGIYLHVPVCKGKCAYCSFYSVGNAKNFDWENYAASLVAELRSRENEMQDWSRVTIYVGGGTPSLMPAELLRNLLRRIKEVVKGVSDNFVEFIETTIEVNPDDVTYDKVGIWKESGIDRISMGIQSLSDSELKAIGRRHDSNQVRDAYSILSEYFINISVDVIFGLPGQDMHSLQSTLEEIVELHPKHISAYSLMYEERSVLMRMLENGLVKETPEDISVGMFELVNKILSKNGYRRYEISNYSLPGYESKHNFSYWEGVPYIGLGPSAHSYNGKDVRRWNTADLNSYMLPENFGKPEFEVENLSEGELMEELLMTRLRITEGLDLSDFRNRFGDKELETLNKKTRRFLKQGLLKCDNDKLCLTQSGIMLSDEIISSLF